MKVIKNDAAKPEEKTLTEILAEIQATAAKIETISEHRVHPIESHLRKMIGYCGYRPRETKKTRATIKELAAQAVQALGLVNGVIQELHHETYCCYVIATHSNLQAELREQQNAIPQTPEPAELPAAPAAPEAPAA